MADAIVSVVLEQLASFIFQETKTGLSLIWGASKAVENLPTTLRTIQAVLRDAEERQVNEETVKLWLDELKEAAYDIEDVLDEWNTSILKWQMERGENDYASKKKVCFFFLSPSFRFRKVVFRCRIALKIKDMNERLDVIAKKKFMYGFNINRIIIEQPQHVKTTSFVNVSEIYGRDEEKNTLISILLSQNDSQQEDGLHIVSVVGMGGIGKTSLAQLVYNNNEVINYFEKRIWVCVSDPFDEVRVAKAIAEALTGVTPNLGELQTILERVKESIVGKKFLLVLDDVWAEDSNKWKPLYECLKNGHNGSKILVTTRKEIVARLMESNIININPLNEEKCWSLFRHLAFFDRSLEECEKLEEVGRKIVAKCKGLLMGINTQYNSLLACKEDQKQQLKTITTMDNDTRFLTWKTSQIESKNHGSRRPTNKLHYDQI